MAARSTPDRHLPAPRAVWVAGLAVALLAAAGLVRLAADGADPPFVTDVPMWTVGSTLHTPEQTYDLGVDVVAFVRTSEGIVFVARDDDGASHYDVYAYAAAGEPELVGETLEPVLRADPDEAYVGWLDGTAEGDLAAVVYDQAAGRRAWSDRRGLEPTPWVVAIDAGTAHLSREPGPTRTVDLASGAESTLREPGRFRHLVSVGGERAAWSVEKDNGADAAVEITSLDSARVMLDHAGGDAAAFSPDGRWVSVVSEQVVVLDAVTGRRVPVDPGGHAQGFGYDWLDGDTLLALAGSEDLDEVALLSCEVPAGTCTEVARLPGDTHRTAAAIGVGEALWEPSSG